MSNTVLPRPSREEVIEAILKANPKLVRGEDMTYSSNVFDECGRVSSGFEIGETISAKSFIISLPLTSQSTITLQIQGLGAADSTTLNSLAEKYFEGKTYLHFYTLTTLTVPNPNIKIGDKINSVDPATFDLVERQVTQNDIDLWNNIHVRFAIS